MVCEGIDTIAKLFLNGFPIAFTKDQFMRYIFDVSNLLVVGTNKLQVNFISAVEYASQLNATYPYELPITDLDQYQHGYMGRNFVRKSQCSFSWDWGPSFPSSGIYKPIYLLATNDPLLLDAVPDRKSVV